MNLLHLLMKVMRLIVAHLMVKGVKEERMVMEILHQTLHQLKVSDNTHILYSACMSTCTAMLHSFMLFTCLCFIIGSDNEDDSTNNSQETQVVVSATAGMYGYCFFVSIDQGLHSCIDPAPAVGKNS